MINHGTNKIWLIADTHFCHNEIIKYCKRPDNYEDLIIENWKNMVASTDVVLHLGDVTMGPCPISLKNLPGIKILKKGNHDDLDVAGHREAYYDMGFNIVVKNEGVIAANRNGHRLAFTHEPLIFHQFDLNIHGHLHNLAKLESVCKHYLVAMEYTDYKPILLDDVLKEVFGDDNHGHV